MTRETTAIVVKEINGPFTLETIRLDTLGPNEALVEIHAVGICHTDISCATGVIPAQMPAVFGHEGVYPLGNQICLFSTLTCENRRRNSARDW